MTKRNEPRGGPPRRRDRLIRELDHDPYHSKLKLPEPTVCPECDAVYREGRWCWVEIPSGVPRTLCPACQRTRDGYPAGTVTLSGEFVRSHREEIVGLARNLEARERPEHPMERIMEIRDEEGATVIDTTGMHLARAIGEGLHRAYEGELDFQYPSEASFLRVSWSR